ncbi:hypothetical protein FOCC_FOCC002070 [Frankliniella occidentalis]|nr:hypothetical protein FOCC_FOCC002070 [Frankliniella occidentalis]
MTLKCQMLIKKKIIKFVNSLITHIKCKSYDKPQFVLVQGMPGTGKTYVLKMCVQEIKKQLGHKSIKVLAPTGVAARIVNGTTLHSFMGLGKYGFNAEQLTGLELLAFRQKHDGLKFLFIDEYSMVGLRITQLPISLCWACTIHKPQGLSLLSVILDAGNSEFALGLLFVALSRVSDFKDLCLLGAISLERLNSAKKSARYKIRRKFLSMLRKMSN